MREGEYNYNRDDDEEVDETLTRHGRPTMGYKRDDEGGELEEETSEREKKDVYLDTDDPDVSKRHGLEEEEPLKEWYNDTLHEALLKKFKIKK